MTSPVTAARLPDTEPDDARAFWAGHGIRKSYTRDQHWRGFMAGKVLAESPKRVLEFGCNVGRNLLAIQSRDRNVRLTGVDVNAVAVAYGRRTWRLDLKVGDAAWLAEQPDDAFDVIFTVSVIDHLPEPDAALEQMARVSPVLLLLEPWLGREGKVKREVIEKTSPYSYSWNLPKRLGALGLELGELEPYPLGDWGLGPYYRLHTARRP